MSLSSSVKVESTTVVLPTYLPASPDKNPMFLEKRVYQGSSGKVYPLPCTDRIAEQPADRRWKAVWIENEFLRAMVLPELGGRIHVLRDKTNGYDLIYHQRVIKPALVGLAGPWISGGIEFNWPQHHRPATFLPVDFEIENHADGSKTIWCSDHDPMTRMKGMHGVCLHPGQARLELKVRAYNRTPRVQTFLWWANVATRVNEAYQSFFPPDVYYVADHARRSMSEYPLAKGCYYGIDYGERGRKGIPHNELPAQFLPPHCKTGANVRLPQAAAGHGPAIPNYAPNDLSFYANIPVPTSYMCMGSQEDFFGGYDHAAQAGIVHIANHHISPGKKQWTWGNHDFGYAWDRNLTEKDEAGEYGPYIEIMAGVYTDNQPDFSFLQPGETKTWSQYWYPIQKIGPAEHANLDAALSLQILENEKRAGGRTLRLGLAVTRAFAQAKVLVRARDRRIFSETLDLLPGKPLIQSIPLPARISKDDLCVRVVSAAAEEVIAYQPKRRVNASVPPPAAEPPPPGKTSSADELFITGLHLEQYRHATRCPTFYWREALRRDPFDSRCNHALGRWHLQRGEFAKAEHHLRRSIQRLTLGNANPCDGEPFYDLGLCLRAMGRWREAYDSFYKACWNQAWTGAGYHALAELDCRNSDWAQAWDHLDRSLTVNSENLRARNLKVMVLRKMGRAVEAHELLVQTLAIDPLDWWARHLNGEKISGDLQVSLDVAHDLARAGFHREATRVLEESVAKPGDLPDQSWGAAPIVQYTLGSFYDSLGDKKKARQHFKHGAALPADYCFPSRVEEIEILESALEMNPRDAKAAYYLGNLLYDRRRHEEAIKYWEQSVNLNPKFSTAWRNLGIGYFNVRKRPAQARAAYEKAFALNPNDARVFFERDQLWKRLREKPDRRLRELEKFPALVQRRDDLAVELGSLLVQTGRYEDALAWIANRHFQPWEGGEGGPLGLHVRAHLGLGRQSLVQGDYSRAAFHFESALTSPANLGEARHLLANQSDVHYWLGLARHQQGEKKASRGHWLAAATFKGDFQEMSVRAFSEMTYYSALAWERLGKRVRSRTLFRDLLAYAQELRRKPARIDYFATSLPTMLLFEDDLPYRQETTALFLEAQAFRGLGQNPQARKALARVLRRDPNHGPASDFLQLLRMDKKNSASP
jgi:tetratricopeptide (TPR) repeat protein